MRIFSARLPRSLTTRHFLGGNPRFQTSGVLVADIAFFFPKLLTNLLLDQRKFGFPLGFLSVDALGATAALAGVAGLATQIVGLSLGAKPGLPFFSLGLRQCHFRPAPPQEYNRFSAWWWPIPDPARRAEPEIPMPTFAPNDTFARRHIGPDLPQIEAMLGHLGVASLDALIEQVVPKAIRRDEPLLLPPARSESEVLAELAKLASENEVWRSYIGMGYHDTHTPAVILRNILENPGWYTAYTPYQSEISQGRMEMLLNFQTMIRDLTGMEVANASLLDEATAAAEAMTMALRLHKGDARVFFVSELCHAQTIALLQTRAAPLGIEILVGDHAQVDWSAGIFGGLLQYPATDGQVLDYSEPVQRAHAAGAMVTVAADLLALTLLRSPGEFGADIVVGSSQRFGVPMGYGGPHAAFMATKESFVRSMPGRLIGVSKDADGKPAYRMALGTREQHIRREKATSNICTAQVLLAVTAAAYAVYHGPAGLKKIAQQVHDQAVALKNAAVAGGFSCSSVFFDTVKIAVGGKKAAIVARAAERKINLRDYDDEHLCVALDETVTDADLLDLFYAFGLSAELSAPADGGFAAPHGRTSDFLTHEVFHRYHSETDMLRYLARLSAKDFTLANGMIPLGSCTMKLNATVEMIPVTMPGFSKLHPFVPLEQARGYQRLFADLEAWLAEITGFDAISLQPNAGSQGEYAGLLAIRAYHLSRGDAHRNICLIPRSAHGTNPASAVMVGMKVVVVECDDRGNVDVEDLRRRAAEHADNLAALMITYPSTHGVFEATVREVCSIVHEFGGQVYMDGANMNAQVGWCRPGDIGADVCHLNLHKTFCIPHGGGGPGMGPIGVRRHLAPFLPGHPVVASDELLLGPVSAAPWGSPSILPISWAYIAMMGSEGLLLATTVAILNANYISKRLEGAYPTLYVGADGRVAHECILDLRPLKAASGVEAEDVAKRLMDYGFHAPTLSFPVAGTLMVEPTESESQAELDRFIEAMLAIREEIRAVETGASDRVDNALKNAPHTSEMVCADQWEHSYSRQQAAFPSQHARAFKFWPSVRRVDNVYGDRNLVCSCLPMDSYSN